MNKFPSFVQGQTSGNCGAQSYGAKVNNLAIACQATKGTKNFQRKGKKYGCFISVSYLKGV